MLGDLIEQIDMNMEKISEFFKQPEKKSKVFDFVLRGDLDECIECMNVLNVLDLDKHGVQFLCFQEEGTSYTDRTRQINGLIEIKEGTTVEGVIRFFRNLDIPLWNCISIITVCEDVNFWLNHSFKKKNRFVGVVLEKGTLTVPPYSPLFKVIETKSEEPLKSQLLKLAEKGHPEAAAVLMSQVLHVPEPEVEDLPDWDRRSRWKKNIY